MHTIESIMRHLGQAADPARLAGMARFGIRTDTALGVSIPLLRAAAKAVCKAAPDEEERAALARALWAEGMHEARILAGMVHPPGLVNKPLMEAWARDFCSWDLTDQCCLNLFRHTAHAWEKAVEWSDRDEEFVKRAAFSLMATLAVGDKKSPDGRFLGLFPLIEREATDPRNYVKKAVNWALRQIGKRSHFLHEPALASARRLELSKSGAARWVGRNAARELADPKTIERITR